MLSLLPFYLFLLIQTLRAAPLDNCARVDSCSACVNSTDGFGNSCQWCIAEHSCASEKAAKSANCTVDDWTLDDYNCPTDVSHVKYDENFMRNIVVPLIAATHSPNRSELTRSLGSCSQLNNKLDIINTYTTPCDKTKFTTCFAYSAYLKDRNAMVIVFRGTTSLSQFIDEGISFFFLPKVPFNVTKGVVDQYYLHAFYALWNQGMREDVQKFILEKRHVKLWFFGHSLGGGLASIASSYVAKTFKLHQSRTKLVTFGMPRIGDIDLAEAHDELVPDSWRIEHRKDPIPSLPPRTFPKDQNRGSFHHTTEIWYPDGMARGARFEIGTRPDTTVGRSVFPFNFDDHKTYFNVAIDDWWKNGCVA